MTELATIRQPVLLAPKEMNDLTTAADELLEIYNALRRVFEAAQVSRRSSPGGTLESLTRALAEHRNQAERQLSRLGPALRDLELSGENAYRAAVSMHLGLLLGSFPTSNMPDPKVFTRSLLGIVMAEGPPIMAVQTACSELLRTQRFIPTISEIMAAVSTHAELWRKRIDACEHIQELVQKMEHLGSSLVVDAKAEAQAEAERAEASKEQQLKNEKAFPIGAEVFHAKLGKGVVSGHRGMFVRTNFVGSRTTRGCEKEVSGSDLARMTRLSGMPSPGQVIFDTWFGRGTISVVEADGSTVTVTLDNGRRELLTLAKEKLCTVLQ